MQVVSALTANDPQFVDNPTVFDPDRWVKGSPSSLHPFASFPFGFGARGCIGKRLNTGSRSMPECTSVSCTFAPGKRLAEFELRLALAKVPQLTLLLLTACWSILVLNVHHISSFSADSAAVSSGIP